MNLDTLIRDQNPQWFEVKYQPIEANWYKRAFYNEIINSLSNDLIIILTGLRRVGKSTLIKQGLGYLLEKHPAQNIFYFSFDGSIVQNKPEVLREILESYAVSFLQAPLQRIKEKVFIFLDEIQIIPHWQDIIKTYYDANSNLKFIVSGSSSLFISRKSTESLAGRLKEIIIPPLYLTEYLELNIQAKEEIERAGGLEKYSHFFGEYLNAFFEKYLQLGQFPQPVVNNYSLNDTQAYLKTIEDKVIEIDLPKAFPIKRQDILKIIFSFLKESSGHLLSYENLTNDLGVDIRTTVKYIDWLKKAYLLDFCLNQTKKRVKSARTSKKIYLTSTNLGQNLEIGAQVETYIFNFLKQINATVEFFRFQNQEIDFVVTNKDGKKIPVEVKYQTVIKKDDNKNIKMFMDKNQSPCAFLITKTLESPPKNGIYCIPAAKMELAKEAFKKKIA